MPKKLLIVGAGGHGRSVAEAVLLQADYTLEGFIDDSWSANQALWDYPILGNTSDMALFRQRVDAAVVAIGNNKARAMMQRRLVEAGIKPVTIIHPKAMVSPRASIGEGSAIMAGAVVGTEAVLGAGVIVNSGAVVDHHCRVGDFAHLGVNAAMAGGSVLGEGAWMQAGSALGYRVRVGAGEILFPGEARTDSGAQTS